MAVAPGSPLSAGPPTSAQLRQLWEAGQRARAIRHALQGWEALLRGADDLGWLERALRTCGLAREAIAVQVRMARRAMADKAAWETLIRCVLETGDPWWARELLREAGSGTRNLEALRIEVELAVGDASELITAWSRDYSDAPARTAAIAWWVRAGRVDEAERQLERAGNPTLWRARFALWRKQPEVARAAIEQLARTAEVCCLDAVAAVQEGDLEQAESLLRALLDSEVGAEAWSWLATVLRKQQRHAEAVQAADAALAASREFNLVTRLERELADARSARDRSMLARLLRPIGLYRGWARKRIGRRTIGELEHAAALYRLGLRPRDSVETLEALLERCAGNRTPYITTTDGVALTSCPLPRDPRHLGVSVRSVLWTRGINAARALYAELTPQVNGHPLFRIYHGELELWMGAYDAAARIFRDILDRDRKVRWAWIGLGASAMFQGRLERAQQIWEEGLANVSALPTLYAYRGECYRRQGEVKKAQADFAVALRRQPERLSARINLALLNREPDALERAVRECVAFAPLLMDELSGGPAERLEGVLQAMRGNRSSSPWLLSYHLWGRIWRRSGNTPSDSA